MPNLKDLSKSFVKQIKEVKALFYALILSDSDFEVLSSGKLEKI